MEALIANQVTKRYTDHLALDQVSLRIPSGSIYGLLGPNGAGKTTLIRIINQIINADSGSIQIFGEDLQQKHVGTIGYLPEERGLYKKMKVGEQLLYLAELKGLSRSQATELSKAWVKKFEITDWWNKKVEDLSKGMAQKIQFISTVMHQPKLIILDEPFSGFDPVNAQLITKEILELRNAGSTIIFSTHRMETVEDLCDHIALINKANKILEGSKREVKNSFRANKFVIEHMGALTLDPERYIVLENKALDEHLNQVVVQSKTPVKANDFIRELVNLTEIQSFSEQIPTMSEIFISLVNGTSHE